MLDLMKAIYSRYDNSTTFKGLLDAGAFYYGRAPQGKDNNYCVYTGLDTLDEKTFRSVIDDIPIQFNIYTKSDTTAVKCFEILEACVELFENQKIEVDNHYDVIFDKSLQVPPVNIDGIKWMAVVEFNVILQREV